MAHHMGKQCCSELCWRAGYDVGDQLDWAAAERVFKQTWGELEAAEMLPAEALQKVAMHPWPTPAAPLAPEVHGDSCTLGVLKLL